MRHFGTIVITLCLQVVGNDALCIGDKMDNQQKVQELPDGGFAVTDAQGNQRKFNSRQEAEAALRQSGSQNVSGSTTQDRPQTQRPDPSRGQS